MNMWEAIVLIVLIASAAKIFRAKHGLPGGKRESRHQSLVSFQSDEAARREAAELRQQLAEVNDRVKVLERIVTDGRHAQSIAAEIEALRDR